VVRLFYALIREIRGEYYIGFMREKCVSYIQKLNIFAALFAESDVLGLLVTVSSNGKSVKNGSLGRI